MATNIYESVKKALYDIIAPQMGIIEPGFCNRNEAPRRQRRVQIWQKKMRAYSGVCPHFFLTKMRHYLAANAVFYCKFRVEGKIESVEKCIDSTRNEFSSRFGAVEYRLNSMGREISQAIDLHERIASIEAKLALH